MDITWIFQHLSNPKSCLVRRRSRRNIYAITYETPMDTGSCYQYFDKCFTVVKISRPKPAIKMQSNRGYELPLVNILKNTMVTSSVPDREGKSQRVIDGPVTSITSAPAHAASSDWICIYQALAKETFAFARSDVVIFRLAEMHVLR